MSSSSSSSSMSSSSSGGSSSVSISKRSSLNNIPTLDVSLRREKTDGKSKTNIWKCVRCHCLNAPEALCCLVCSALPPIPLQGDEWACFVCYSPNAHLEKSCSICGTPFHLGLAKKTLREKKQMKANSSLPTIMAIQNKFAHPIHLLDVHRHLVHQGKVSVLQRIFRKTYQFFLFSDLLVVCDSTSRGYVLTEKIYLTFRDHVQVEDALQLLADENILSVPVQSKTPGRLGPHHSYYVKESKILGFLSLNDLSVAIVFQQCFAEFKDTPAKIAELNQDSFRKHVKTSIFSANVSDLLGLTSESKVLWEYEETEKLDTILEVMSKGVHRVLVHTKDGKLRILSQSDVVSFLKRNLSHLGDIGSEEVGKLGLVDEKSKLITLSMYDSALSGYQKMYNNGWDVPAVPVVDKTGDVVATLSTSDLRGLNKSSFSSLLLPVLDFLQQARGGARQTIWTQPSSTFSDVILKAAWGKVHRVWVIKAHKLVGVISLSDIICKFSPFDFKKPSS